MKIRSLNILFPTILGIAPVSGRIIQSPYRIEIHPSAIRRLQTQESTPLPGNDATLSAASTTTTTTTSYTTTTTTAVGTSTARTTGGTPPPEVTSPPDITTPAGVGGGPPGGTQVPPVIGTQTTSTTPMVVTPGGGATTAVPEDAMDPVTASSAAASSPSSSDWSFSPLTVPEGGLRPCNQVIDMVFVDNILPKEVILTTLNGMIDNMFDFTNETQASIAADVKAQMESLVTYSVRARKVCTSCEEANAIWAKTHADVSASEVMPYCMDGKFAYGRTIGGLVLEPIDSVTGGVVSGNIAVSNLVLFSWCGIISFCKLSFVFLSLDDRHRSGRISPKPILFLQLLRFGLMISPHYCPKSCRLVPWPAPPQEQLVLFQMYWVLEKTGRILEGGC